jgi:HAD superfamily hydrolase (TIGR01662 family)
MALRAVFFDVGETLVNEEGYWGRVARLLGVPRHVVIAGLGATIARGEPHRRVYEHLGVERPAAVDDVVYGRRELYPDAVPCLARLRADGYLVGVAGNQTAALERWARNEGLPVDVIGSSARWGVSKPEPAFFARVVSEAGCEPDEVAYVGDRVDNDVVPAAEAGLVAVHVRRGPWGYLQRGAERAHVRVDSLAELPEALAALRDPLPGTGSSPSNGDVPRSAWS